MGKVEKFEDLYIFQKARSLSKSIYAITRVEPFKSDFRFVQQIHASSGFIMDNIAEGFERDGNKEFIYFLYVAKGSCGEVRSQLLRANDVNFIDNETFNQLYYDYKSLSASIANFIKALQNSNIKGNKFKYQQSSLSDEFHESIGYGNSISIPTDKSSETSETPETSETFGTSFPETPETFITSKIINPQLP